MHSAKVKRKIDHNNINNSRLLLILAFSASSIQCSSRLFFNLLTDITISSVSAGHLPGHSFVIATFY